MSRIEIRLDSKPVDKIVAARALSEVNGAPVRVCEGLRWNGYKRRPALGVGWAERGDGDCGVGGPSTRDYAVGWGVESWAVISPGCDLGGGR